MSKSKSTVAKPRSKKKRESSVLEYVLSPFFAWRLASS